jgi:hypothetical protein
VASGVRVRAGLRHALQRFSAHSTLDRHAFDFCELATFVQIANDRGHLGLTRGVASRRSQHAPVPIRALECVVVDSTVYNMRRACPRPFAILKAPAVLYVVHNDVRAEMRCEDGALNLTTPRG